MHISKVYAEDFKRFTKIEIVDLPATARLVVLAGPNGNGKSSLFDLFVNFFDRHSGLGGGWHQEYHTKIIEPGIIPAPNRTDVAFHEGSRAEPQKRFYFRTAYRNQPEFASGKLTRPQPALQERRISRFIDNDEAVAANYQRLYAHGLETAFEDDESKSLAEWKRQLLGDVQTALNSVLPDLKLKSLGNPFKVNTFKFSKGKTQDYNYMNLSGGEKAAFDLLLDFVIKKREFDDTVFCIDEPEAHLNTRVHGRMLEALLNLVDVNSQLWIATHAIGMMRKARDLYFERKGEVVFLDFDKDFDLPQVLRPIVPDRLFWEKTLTVALDDMAALVAPKLIIACESGKKDTAPGEGYDAEIYNRIFGAEFPEVRFMSIGATSHMEGDRFLVLEAIDKVIQGTKVTRLIDRDDLNDVEKSEKEAKGYRVLSRRHIESYLFDEEVLTKLCESVGKDDKLEEVLAAKQAALEAAAERNGPEHMKAAAGRLFVTLKKVLEIGGQYSNTFMRDVLAPLVVPGMKVYDELKADIFPARAEPINSSAPEGLVE